MANSPLLEVGFSPGGGKEYECFRSDGQTVGCGTNRKTMMMFQGEREGERVRKEGGKRKNSFMMALTCNNSVKDWLYHGKRKRKRYVVHGPRL